MSIFIRPFEISDYTAFDPIETINEPYDPEFVQAIADSELAFTGIKDDKVMGCGGVHPVDDVHGEIWLRLSEECLNHKIEILRLMKDGQKILEESYPFRQLDAAIKCCFDAGIRMAEWLGYEATEEKTVGDTQWRIFSKRVQE